MKFEVRTTAPTRGTKPYAWGVSSEGQCTWGVYYRVQEMGFTPPCYWDRATKTGAYTNAKLWPENYREPWAVKNTSYIPVPGDIVVFDGNYGHVIVIEDNLGDDNYLISQWNKDSDCKYSSDVWHLGDRIIGKKYPTGNIKAYMHFSNQDPIIRPVEEDTSKDQILVKTSEQNLRNAPNGDIVGKAESGYYYVKNITTTEDYTWYQLADDIWIAKVLGRVEFIPANDEPIVDPIQKKLDIANDKLARIQAILDESEE